MTLDERTKTVKEWLDRELTLEWLRREGPVDAAVYATVLDCQTLFRNLLEAESHIECAKAINEFEFVLWQRLHELNRGTK